MSLRPSLGGGDELACDGRRRLGGRPLPSPCSSRPDEVTDGVRAAPAAPAAGPVHPPSKPSDPWSDSRGDSVGPANGPPSLDGRSLVDGAAAAAAAAAAAGPLGGRPPSRRDHPDSSDRRADVVDGGTDGTVDGARERHRPDASVLTSSSDGNAWDASYRGSRSSTVGAAAARPSSPDSWRSAEPADPADEWRLCQPGGGDPPPSPPSTVASAAAGAASKPGDTRVVGASPAGASPPASPAAVSDATALAAREFTDGDRRSVADREPLPETDAGDVRRRGGGALAGGGGGGVTPVVPLAPPAEPTDGRPGPPPTGAPYGAPRGTCPVTSTSTCSRPRNARVTSGGRDAAASGGSSHPPARSKTESGAVAGTAPAGPT